MNLLRPHMLQTLITTFHAICVIFCSTELRLNPQIQRSTRQTESNILSQPSSHSTPQSRVARQAIPYGKPPPQKGKPHEKLPPKPQPQPTKPPQPLKTPQPKQPPPPPPQTTPNPPKPSRPQPSEPQSKTGCCNREKDCVYWGECCFDTFKDEYSGADYIAYFLQRTEVRKHFKEIPILNKKLNPTHDIDKMYMICTCGNKTSPFYRTCNTLHSDDDFPVYDKNEVVYRNLACAKCHNELGSFSEVDIRVACGSDMKSYINGSEPNSFSLGDIENCNFLMEHPRKYLHLKTREKFFRKPEAILCSEIERLLCESHMYVIYEVDRWANPYCLACNYGFLSEWECSTADFDQYQRLKRLGVRPTTFPFSLMVSRTNKGVIEEIPRGGPFKRSQVCGNGFLFSLLKGKCIEYHCEPGYTKSRGKCVREHEKSIGIDSVRHPGNTSIFEAMKQCMINFTGSVIYKFINNSIKKNVSSLLDINHSMFARNRSIFFSKREQITSNSFVLKYEDITYMESAPETMYISLLTSLPATFLFGFSPKHHISDGRICKSPVVFDDFNISADCGINVHGTEYQLFENGTFWIEISNDKVQYFASVCSDNNYFLRSSCAKLFYSNPSVRVDTNLTANIKTKDLNLILEASEYVPETDGIKICIPEASLSNKNSENFPFEFLVWDIEFYIASSLLGVSLLFELSLLVTYVSIKELQNTPGRIVMALSTILGMSDASILSLIIGAPLTENICDIFGPLLHWLSFSLHLWTLVMAYDLWRTFRHSFQKRENKRNDFLKLGTFVGVVSSLIVGFVLVLEYSTDFKVNYGVLKGRDSCWIKSEEGRLYSYLVPTYIVLATIIILLVFTMRNIKQNMEPTMSAQNNRNLPVMAMKLTCVLGIPEVVSVIAVPRDSKSLAILSHVITLLYNILRSSRGIFLFIIFVLTKNVIKHAKKKLSRQKNTSTLSVGTVEVKSSETSL